MFSISHPKKFGLFVASLVAGLAGIIATVSTPVAANDGPRTYEVTLTNLTESQYFTPPNWAVHSARVDVFSPGDVASPGVQAVAENGGVPVLAAELEAAIDNRRLGDSGVGTGGVEGPIGPGESRTFEIKSNQDRLSLVAMVVCTNDGFVGLDSQRLPNGLNRARVLRLSALDAGTEKNTELRQDLVPAPFCGEGEGTGESNPELAEGDVIRRHQTLQGVGDLNPDLDWRGSVATVSIKRIS